MKLTNRPLDALAELREVLGDMKAQGAEVQVFVFVQSVAPGSTVTPRPQLDWRTLSCCRSLATRPRACVQCAQLITEETMTKKRRCLISVGILAACVCATLVVFALVPEPGVTKTNFDRIEKGMTEADAEAIFGRPSGSTLTIVDQKNGFASTIRFDAGKGCSWHGADGDVMVLFDKDRRISRATWIEHERTLLEKIHDWLRLPK